MLYYVQELKIWYQKIDIELKEIMKVIIADDEKLICELIKSLIDWDELGLTFLGFAYSGIELYNLMDKETPDIIITDINMPVLNGIDFVKKIRREDNNTRVIIITGYQDFEYAHSAIKYNVDDFLLKPINKQELNKSLEKIISNINKEKINDFTNELIIDSLNPSNLYKLFEMHRPEWLTGNYYQFIHFKTLLDGQHDLKINSTLLNKFQNIIIESLNKLKIENLMFPKETLIRVLIKSNQRIPNFNNIFQDIYESMNEYAKIFANTRVYLFIEEPKSSFNEVLSSIPEINRIIASQLIDSEQYITDYKLIDKRTNTKSIVNFFNIIRSNVTLNKFDEVIISINDLKYVDPNPFDIYTIHLELEKLYEFIISEHFSIYGYENNLALNKEKFDNNIYYSNKFGDFIERDLNLISELIEGLNRYLTEKISLPIEKATDYIHENYQSVITLEDVSSFVKLAPTYFSSIFKKQTGKTFVEYLNNYRIERAKHHLVTSTKSISEIGYIVGFNEPKYFSKTFRRIVGVKPSEYRRMFG